MKTATLTRRIATILVMAAAAVFTLTAIALDRVLERKLAQRDSAELVGKVEQLRHLIAERATADRLQANSHPFDDIVIGHEGLGFIIADATGTVLLKSGAELSPIGDASLIRPIAAHATPRIEDVRFIERGETHWRVLAASAGSTSGTEFRILVGRDVHAAVDMRATFRSAMLAGSLVAAFGTALIGSLAVWRGVRPLRTMATAARRITTNRLTERVEVPPRSVGEVRELAEAFNGMIDRLEDGFTRLSRFSADLAHDLLTPVTNLLLQAQIGLSRTRSAEEYQALLASNIEQFERMQRMVEGMLFLARAENAQIALRREPVHLHGELAHLCEFFQLSADEKSVRLTPSGQATVEADAALLSRALGNLISNAIRHARSGTEVRIQAKLSDRDAVVEIVNEGEVIPKEDLPHLFDRFWRGDRARAGAEISSGLGLSIVRSIVALHAGDVSVESSGGVTAFRLRLPRRSS